MAPLIPVALSLGGSALAGQLGSAVGWMVGAWVFGQLQPKDPNDILDPGAQEMPRFNQALRGSSMPVIFGTNRVSSQIIWQKNFTTIRNETTQGGGGKPGGSGGGKGASQSTEITYNYTWDLVYHLGMVPEGYSLYGGWLGSDKLGDDTITAIQNNSSGTPFVGLDEDRPQNASLVFEEGFFYAGEGAGSSGAANVAGWSHLAQEEAGSVRWPHTSYIGFKAMDLGNNPHIPQLTWEIGPGEAQATFDSGYIGSDGVGTSVIQADYGGSFVRDASGVRYMVTGDNNGAHNASVFNLDTGTRTDFVTDTEFDAMATTIGLDPGSNYDFTSGTDCSVINEQYVLLWGYDVGVGSRSNWAFVVCEIGTDGLLNEVGGFQCRSDNINSVISIPLCVGIAGTQANGSPVIMTYINSVAASRDVSVIVLPSIVDMITAPVIQDTSGYMEGIVTDFNGLVSGDYFGSHNSYGEYNGFGWFLPDSAGETRWYCYIGRQDMKYVIDNPGAAGNNAYIETQSATYPWGMIVYFNMGLVQSGTAPTVSGPTVCNSDFQTRFDTSAIVPFDDAGLNKDETQDAEDDYYPRPQVVNLAQGGASDAFVVVFNKRFSGSGDLSPTGTYGKMRAFMYNLYTEVFQQHTVIEGSTIDTVADMGVSEANRYNYTPYDIRIFFDQENNSLIEYRHWQSADANLNAKHSSATFGTMIITGGADVLPPYIIYEILTNPWFGLGWSVNQINTASYVAALEYCDANNFRVSTQYRRESGSTQIIEELLALYGGFLVFSSGQWSFKIQEANSISNRTIDNTHFVVGRSGEPPVVVTKGALQDTYNRIRINYIDRTLDYRQNQVEEQDEVDQDLNGVRMKEFPARFVMNEQMARTMAERALWGNLYARDTYSFKLGWKDADLEPGDLITLVDSYHPHLQGGVTARIAYWKEENHGQFEVIAKQELDYISATSGTTLNITSISFNDKIGKVPAPIDFFMYELPCEFQTNNTGRVYVSWLPDEFAAGARLYLSTDNLTFAPVQNIQPYPLGGRVITKLPATIPGAMQENVEFLMFPKSDWYSTNSYYFSATMNEALPSARAVGAALMWIGSEMIAYEGVTLVGQNHYRVDKVYRGWGGTNIHDHSSGDIWVKQGGGIFFQDVNEDKIGTVLYYKVLPYNLSGFEIDVASVTAKSYTIEGQHYRPQNAGHPRFIQNSVDHRGLTKINVSSEGDIGLDWRNTSRKFGFGVGGYGQGTGGYGRFTAESISWRVEIVGSGDTVVRSTSVNTSHYTYTNSNNFADNGAWRGNIGVKVTPYNDFGDAIRTSVVSLELFI